MAEYTVTLKQLIDSNFDLGLKTYPIYKEEYREPLNNLIKEHFMFREIGLETAQLFKFHLNRKMNEIMPYYNQLYKSEDVEFNPLWNVEMYETLEQTGENKVNNKQNSTLTGTNTGTNTNSQNNSGENIAVEDDSPQSQMSLDDIRNNNYASKIEKENSKNSSSESQTSNSTNNETSSNTVDIDSTNKDNYSKKTWGASAGYSFSQLITQWRNIMININMQIIEELEPLFMQIF